MFIGGPWAVWNNNCRCKSMRPRFLKNCEVCHRLVIGNLICYTFLVILELMLPNSIVLLSSRMYNKENTSTSLMCQLCFFQPNVGFLTGFTRYWSLIIIMFDRQIHSNKIILLHWHICVIQRISCFSLSCSQIMLSQRAVLWWTLTNNKAVKLILSYFR